MRKQFLRTLSILLTLVLVVNLLPLSILAEEYRETIAIVPTEPVSEPYIVSEVVENRTQFSKEFRLSNGLHIAAVYADAVHYEEDGQWKQIDNTLKLSGSAYTNTAGIWDVSFPRQLSGEGAVTVTKDGHTLTFTLKGQLRSSQSSQLETASMSAQPSVSLQAAQAASAQLRQVDLSADLAQAEYPQLVLQQQYSRLEYNRVYPDTDIVYDLSSTQVKESIVMDAYDAALQGYQYYLDTGTMTPVLTESGTIELYDRDTLVMTMPAPYLVDNSEQYCYDVAVALKAQGSGYTLTYSLPRDWLSDQARQWPVILDPIVSAVSSYTNIKDVSLYQYNRPYGYQKSILDCGHNTEYGIMRILMKFAELPALTSADVVLGAQLELCKPNNHSTVNAVQAHKVLGTWESPTATWENQPAHDPTVEDYAIVQNAGYYYWDVTDIVRGWYEGENTGLMLRAPDEIENTTSTDSYRKQFYSSEFDNVHRPALTITFRNNNGLESYWDYTSFDAGRAGTGYINNFSGNLVWLHSDIGFDGNRMPVSISHVYNANDTANNAFGMGYGWRTNFNQRVYQWSADSSYYVWEDADGTAHYFPYDPDSGSYKDEDGLELTSPPLAPAL